MTQKKKKSVPSKHIHKGKGVTEPSKEAKLMDVVDQAMKVHFKEEILMDILTRLPVRSLLRFKCVSRFWKTLISEPYFRMKHLNRSKNDQNSQKFLICHLLLEEGIFSMYCCPLSSVQLVEDVQKLDFPLVSEPRYCTIGCHCDGLFIIRVYDNVVERRILLLWNPSTGESIVVPAPKFPVEGFSCLGLSYDSISGDYLILKIDETGDSGRKVPGEILALKSGSWRVIDEHPGLIRNVVSGMHSLAFVHGAFHWVGISGNSLKYSMVSFNISRDVYGEIQLPEQICMIRDVINIGISVLDGMICAYSNMDHQGNDTFRLWVMKDYGLTESWNEVFTIADPYISMATPKYKFLDGEVLFWCLQRGDSVFRTQRERSKLWPRGVFQNGFAFTESLISPKLLT